MSLTRNKRKRPENEHSAIVPASRRRSRDSRARADLPSNESSQKKEVEATSEGSEDATSNKQRTSSTTENENESKAEKISCNDEVAKASQAPNDETETLGPGNADVGSGSVEGGSCPKEPLHISASGHDVQNTSVENPDPDANERAAKIRELIAHRSLLLLRIRLCRSAADKRLADTKSTAQIMGKKTGGSLREMTDDEEIESYRELAKLASQAAKKARGEGEGQNEKRTSLSLRRGSGVGKRMNAALISLAPGTSSSTAGHSASGPTKAPVDPEGTNVLMAPPPAGVPAISLAGQVLGGQMPVNLVIPQASGLPKSAKAASSQGLHRQSSLGGAESKQIRPSAGKAFKSNTTTIPRTSSVTKVDHMPASLRPGNPNPNIPPRILQPKTNFTQAMMLRKQRDAVHSKLAEFMERQTAITCSDSVRHSAMPLGTTNQSPVSFALNIPPKVALPKRRKTHWDRLLQEMSWLATDFIEERKWKMSSARSVSFAILSRGITLGNMNSTLKQSKSEDLPTTVEVVVDAAGSVLTESEEVKTKTCAAHENERKYPQLSSEDMHVAKKAAELASSMITDLVGAIQQTGAMGPTGDIHSRALDRYTKIREKLLNDTMPIPKSTNKIERISDEGNPQGDVVQVGMDDSLVPGANSDSDSGEVTFSEISRRINDLGVSRRKTEKFAFKELATAIIGKRLKILGDQKEMIEFVDTLWQNSSPGAMISGLPTSGKTVATCCLLWKRRIHGPQLLICPAASMLRWKYEVSLFKDLRALNFGSMGGISCALKNPVVQISIPGAGDIVLCEYSSVGMILGLVREKKINFRSICIDCRHPEGMFGSVGTYNSNSRHNSGWHGASELITAEWWDNVIALASREDIRRLIVDYCDPDIYSLQRSGLGQRQQLEIMSLRTAFLVGPRTFRPSNYSLPRTVISWARHQDKKCGEDKFERVRRVLQETLSPLSTCDGRPLCSFPFTTWEIRECEMPYAQRAAYDSCCSHIRGALSSSLGVANTQDDFGSSTYHAIATALFRLRQICLCSSNLDRRATGEKILSGERLPFIHTEPCSVDTAPTEASLFKMASDNSSQQDHELAEALLSNSGKFSQLIAILEKECGYTLDCDKDVRKLIECAWSGKAVDVAFRRKVVILANLPMTQWLVSILLGSLGIRHKLIRREFSHTSNPSNEEVRKHKQAALSWAESQTTLTAFNSEEHIRDKLGIYASSDVLIVSPDSLASWHGGVGIDNADFVISLDEDWSGRELGTLEAAMSRWKAITTLRKSSSKTIRLICKNSIEMRVFSKGTSNSFQYPLDQSGNHLLYRDIDELIPIYREAVESRAETANLPGIDILQLRGEALQEVLLPSKRLAPLFGNGSSLLFLPLTYDNEVPEKRDYAEVKRELSFLRALFELECRETSKDLSSSFTDSFTFTKKLHFGSGVLPPEPRSFPEHVMSRSDLQFLSIRYYFERQVVSSGPSSSASNGVSLLQVCLPGEKAPNNVVSPADGHSQDGSAFADAWQKSGLGSKSDEKAKSLLCYRANDEQTAIEHNNKDSFDGGRFNVYSKIYSSTWESNAVQDGNQGYEPVVFLPPVYPKIQLAPLPSKANIHPVYKEESQQSHKARVVPSNPKIAQKRKEIDASKHSDQSNLKRHRTDSFADLVDSPANGANAVVGRSVKASLSAREAGRQNENFSAHIPVQNELPDAMSEKSAKIESENHDNDDYGLLGRGALLLPVYSALLMANESTTVGKSISSCDDFVQNRFPCDTEEVSTLLLGNDDERLGSVALFVKKCPRILSPIGDLADQPHRPHIGLLQGDQRRILPNHAAPVDISTPVMTPQANGDEIGKKLKKKASGEGISSAFTRMPNAGVSVSGVPPIPTSVNPKSGHRHRMLATYASRQLGTGLSMFESASYRTAMLHVQKRIRKRIDMSLMKNCLSNETGPGIPMFASNHPKAITEIAQGVVHFGNFVEKLKEGSSTGDASKSLATVQRAALRRSLVSPCRVDFGPFEGGFLSSPTGMTAISPPRSRIGVSLPMGVKVAHVTHDQMQPTWTAQDDKQLQEAAVKFGMNWIVIARALSGVNGFVVADSGGSEFTRRLAPPPRSSRQCRDRWQYLARSQPSLAGEVRKSEKILRENALIRAESLVNSEDICTSSLGPSDQEGKIILLSRASLFANNVDDKMKIDGDISPNNAADVSNDVKMSSDRPKRSFSIFKAAMAKRQVVPLTLPGIPPGGQPNQPVPSHPSHMQSVQSSVAAQLSNGRTEMWPLQILDCADKHRAASRASAAQRSTDVPAASVPSTVARNPTTSTSSSSAVPPSGNLRAPVTNRPPATNVPSRTASVQRPATSSHPSPSKAKLVSDIGSQANVVPNSSPVAKKSDKSKTPASPTKKS